MDKSHLDKQRDVIIEEIKRVFPLTPRPKELVRKHFRKNWEGESLIKILEGKSWADLIEDYSFVYAFSNVDNRTVITEKAFAYFLPAFLIHTTKQPDQEVSINTFVEIRSIASKFDLDQLKALISYFTYQEQYWREESFDMIIIQKIEDTLLRLLFALDEKKSKP